MAEYRIQYVIGVKDGYGYYVVTDISNINKDTVIPVSENQYVSIPKAYIYPYNTFKKDFVISGSYDLAVLKLIMPVNEKEEEFKSENAVMSNTNGKFVEEIRYRISLANKLINKIYEEGNKETAIEIRRKILTEHAYFPILTKGCITSYFNLLTNNEFVLIDGERYHFPLTKQNLRSLDDLLDKNIPIDYSLLVKSDTFGRVNSFVRDGEIENISEKAFVILFSHIPFDMMDWNPEYHYNENIVLEAYRQGNKKLLDYLFECKYID